MELGGDWVIYGAGGFGRDLSDLLGSLGSRVVAILDRGARGNHRGIPIVGPEEWRTFSGYRVVLGIHNPGTDLRAIEMTLREVGYTEVFSPVSAFLAAGEAGLSVERYWLSSDRQVYSDNEECIAQARGLLADEESRRLWDAILRYRVEGSIAEIPEPRPLAEQYFAPDLLPRINFDRVVDCGAFDGDTLRGIADNGLRPSWVLALEPDPENFMKLCATARGLPEVGAVCVPVGVWSESTQLRFAADGSAGASVSDDGDLVIQVARLDDLLGAWAPTYIKMDVEGAELDALAGAQRSISQGNPALAISIYHRPTDLWEIPLWLTASFPGSYDYRIRQYGANCFDTVLYAIPSTGA